MKNFKGFITEQEEEVHASEITDLIKSVGGGTKSAAVFESWVHIVSQISGDRRKPTKDEVQKVRGSSEFDPGGDAWLKKIGFGTPKAKFEENKVLLAMYFIGGDIKDIKGISWGSGVDVIHDSIDDYYNKLPDIWKTEASKQNTADIVFITKGNKAQLFAELPNCTEKGTINWTDTGKMSIPEKKLEWYQISLKKGIDDARIGKLGEYLKGKYSGSGFASKHDVLATEEIQQRGTYLGMAYGFDETADLILLDEGLFSVFKDIKDKVTGSIKKLASWASAKLKGLLKGAIGLARRVLKSNPVIDNANEILKLSGTKLTEDFLLEADEEVEFKKPKDAVKRFEILYKQLSSDMINKEYYKLKSNADALNGKKSETKINPAVLMYGKESDAVIDTEYFKQKCQIVIDKLNNNDRIYRSDLFMPFKVASHYTGYNTMNVILNDISTNIKEHEGVIAAAMTFVAQTKAEAKFGNTQLPLWIVYGQGGGAHYYGIKDTYIETQTKDMLNNPEVKKLDQPYVVIRIEKAGKSKSSYGEGGHNVTEMYLMSGIDDKQSMPLYLLLNLTTVSGSRFSMKAEVEKELPKKWI